MPKRPPVIRDKDTIEFRLTEQSESRLPFVFVETLDEATLAERSLRVYEEAARDRRLIHVLNRSTDGILGTAMVQPSSDGKRPLRAEVGGLAVHPGARGFGIASHLFKVMMVYAVKESGRDQPDEQYIGHVVEGNVASIAAVLGAGFRSTGIVELHRNDIDAGIDHLIQEGGSFVRMDRLRPRCARRTHSRPVEIRPRATGCDRAERSGRRCAYHTRFLAHHQPRIPRRGIRADRFLPRQDAIGMMHGGVGRHSTKPGSGA